MWSTAFLCLFLALSFHCQVIEGNEFVTNRTDARLSGYLTLHDDRQSEYDELKFIAYIKEVDGDTQIGNGIIINKFWVLTVLSVTSPYTPSGIMVVICANPIQIQGLNRNVKEIVDNSDCATSPLQKCVSLLRVCPSISDDHFAPIASSLTGYRDTTKNMYLYRHINDAGQIVIQRGIKKIGELCECMDITNWNLASHVCLTLDASVYAEATDMQTVVVTNDDRSEVIGFLIVEQSAGSGEVVLHIEAVRTFINTYALETPYQYP